MQFGELGNLIQIYRLEISFLSFQFVDITVDVCVHAHCSNHGFLNVYVYVYVHVLLCCISVHNHSYYLMLYYALHCIIS